MKKILENKMALFMVLSYALSIASMVIIFILLGRVIFDDLTSASIFLGIALLCEAGYTGILTFKYSRKKDIIRITIVAISFVVSAIMAFISNNDNYVFFLVSAFLFLITLALNRFLSITRSNEAKWNFTNCLLGILFLICSPIVFLEITEISSKTIVILIGLLLLLMAFKKLVLPYFNFEKIKVLINILNVTHTLDILICLLALMIAFSFVFVMVEPTITNFWDGLWYSFAVITTIGFGDFYAQTVIGRILTVILGLYGIVIVAILTSVIVNFYNAITDKSTEKKMNEIVKGVMESKETEEDKPKEKETKSKTTNTKKKTK